MQSHSQQSEGCAQDRVKSKRSRSYRILSLEGNPKASGFTMCLRPNGPQTSPHQGLGPVGWYTAHDEQNAAALVGHVERLEMSLWINAEAGLEPRN